MAQQREEANAHMNGAKAKREIQMQGVAQEIQAKQQAADERMLRKQEAWAEEAR